MSITAIVLRGPFSDEDLGRLMMTLREIDNNNPDGTFEMAAVDPTASPQEMARKLMQSLPPVEGRETAPIRVLPHDDDVWIAAMKAVMIKHADKFVTDEAFPLNMLAVFHDLNLTEFVNDLFTELAKTAP